MPRRPPRSTLFPYTTLFRSSRGSIPSASTAERWSVSGTVTFSSTLSAPLIRASNCCNCSSDSRGRVAPGAAVSLDRKSTRLNSSHVAISYAVFCLKKKSQGEGSNEAATPSQADGGRRGLATDDRDGSRVCGERAARPPGADELERRGRIPVPLSGV